MTGQTTAAAHAAGTLTAADRITPDAASPRALRVAFTVIRLTTVRSLP